MKKKVIKGKYYNIGSKGHEKAKRRMRKLAEKIDKTLRNNFDF